MPTHCLACSIPPDEDGCDMGELDKTFMPTIQNSISRFIEQPSAESALNYGIRTSRTYCLIGSLRHSECPRQKTRLGDYSLTQG